MRPFIVCPNNIIFVETWSPFYEDSTDFITTIAEPISRPTFVHEYKLTEQEKKNSKLQDIP
jgi:DNA excision repair protein ERCC-3